MFTSVRYPYPLCNGNQISVKKMTLWSDEIVISKGWRFNFLDDLRVN